MLKILKRGIARHNDVKYLGVCKRCGCEFEVEIQRVTYATGHVDIYTTTDIEKLHLQRCAGILMCDCPECTNENIELTEIE